MDGGGRHLSIRPALEADLDRMVELGRQMHAESWYSHMPFDPAILRRTIAHLIQVGFAWVHESAGEVDGGMIGLMAPSWFGPGYIACDLAVFVTQDKRGGLAAYRLAEAFIQWAGKRGVLEINLAISTNVLPERLGALYQRMGFTKVGGVYKLRMHDVHRL